MSNYFEDINELASFIQEKERGNIVVAHQNLTGYPGMVLYVGMLFNMQKAKYELHLEWMCWGLDFYGDTLQESYHYKFDSLEKMVEYIGFKNNIKVSDILIKYKFDTAEFPNVLKDEAQKPVFELAWKQFQEGFRNGDFLDPAVELVYASKGF